MALTFCISSCEPSIEEYTKQWQDMEGFIASYANKYPSFKTEIRAQFEDGKKLWEKVESITDEDVKKAQMKLAIATTKSGALKRITTLEKSIKNIEDYKNKFRDLPSDYFTSKTKYLIEDADLLLPKAETILNNTYTSVDSAYILFDDITRILVDQEKRMEKHMDEIERKRQKIKRENELIKKERQERKALQN